MAIEPLLADPFSWIHGSDGRVDTREAWLSSAANGMALSGQRNIRSEHGVALAFYGGSSRQAPHTVVRTARIRLRTLDRTRETWMRQVHVFVRGGSGHWQLALGQGTLMYEGAAIDAAIYPRYVGVYQTSDGRTLSMSTEDESLFARLPNGSTAQIFLASPTEEIARTTGGGRFRFTLDPQGQVAAVTLVRGDDEIWRANRTKAP